MFLLDLSEFFFCPSHTRFAAASRGEEFLLSKQIHGGGLELGLLAFSRGGVSRLNSPRQIAFDLRRIRFDRFLGIAFGFLRKRLFFGVSEARILEIGFKSNNSQGARFHLNSGQGAHLKEAFGAGSILLRAIQVSFQFRDIENGCGRRALASKRFALEILGQQRRLHFKRFVVLLGMKR